jgi:hypothetical protein
LLAVGVVPQYFPLYIDLGKALNHIPKEGKKVQGFPYNNHVGVIMRKKSI